MNILDLETILVNKGYRLSLTMIFGIPPVIIMRYIDEDIARLKQPEIVKLLPPDYESKIVSFGPATASIVIYKHGRKVY